MHALLRSRLAAGLASLETRAGSTALALGIVFLAFALRAYRLGAVGLEGDEAFSIQAAYSGLTSIVHMASTGEPHPPLYYSFLGLWYQVFGVSEFSLRFPSLIAGVLTVAALSKLADRLGWHGAGLVSALLFALNPLQVWYAQEARMYAPVALFGLLALYCSLRAVQERRLHHLAL